MLNHHLTYKLLLYNNETLFICRIRPVGDIMVLNVHSMNQVLGSLELDDQGGHSFGPSNL